MLILSVVMFAVILAVLIERWLSYHDFDLKLGGFYGLYTRWIGKRSRHDNRDDTPFHRLIARFDDKKFLDCVVSGYELITCLALLFIIISAPIIWLI